MNRSPSVGDLHLNGRKRIFIYLLRLWGSETSFFTMNDSLRNLMDRTRFNIPTLPCWTSFLVGQNFCSIDSFPISVVSVPLNINWIPKEDKNKNTQKSYTVTGRSDWFSSVLVRLIFVDLCLQRGSFVSLLLFLVSFRNVQSRSPLPLSPVPLRVLEKQTPYDTNLSRYSGIVTDDTK